MEYLLDLLSKLSGDPDHVRIAFVALIAVCVFLLGLAVSTLVGSATSPVRRRIQQIQAGDKLAPAGHHGLSRVVDSTAPYVLPKNDGEQSRIRVRLIHAGYRSPNAITIFFATKLLLGVATPMLVVTLATFYAAFTTMQVAAAAFAGALLGLFAPNIFLSRQVEKRQRILYDGFPDALDMLVVCVEAGLGLNAAIQRVAEELTVSHPGLAEELGLVNAEIRAGVDRIEALRNLADRTGLDDIRGLVALLAQSVRFGTSVAETLRVYSEEFRDKRMQRAEELAAKIGTKLIFPMVLCLFPSFFLVAVGPAIVGVLEVFKNM